MNKTGKGGFVDNPQNRNNGRWNKEDSISYWQRYFLKLPIDDFNRWLDTNPDRTVAQQIAHASVENTLSNPKAITDLQDRVEGKPRQTVENVQSEPEYDTVEAIKDMLDYAKSLPNSRASSFE